jgi:hypothetical protein
MNPIELTNSHKLKLLEMCRELFPLYMRIDLDINENYSGTQVFIEFEQEPIGLFHIHWFEFCMTKLWIKINSLLNHKTSEELMLMYNAFWDISNEKLHPIDYLYKQFKRLKTK